MTTRRGRPSRRRRWIAVATAAVVVLLLVARCQRGGMEAGVERVVLISIDTCRADRIGAYGLLPEGAPSPTPHLDVLAREGVLFENVVAPAPMTLPAHCSLMTGAVPPAHGVHDNMNYRLAPEHVTLAEVMRARGYTTGAVIAAFVLDRQFGLHQGFASYDDRIGGTHAAHGILERKGGDVTRRARAWLDTHRDENFFLFLHYFDPHDDYEPPEPFASRFADDPYTGEVAFVDRCVGEVVSHLKTLGLYESTLLVVVGDHGEMLGEHGEPTHSFFIYQGAVRVPMIWKLPGRRAARRVAAPVGIVDVMPTLCRLLAVEDPPAMQGMDLSPVLNGTASMPPDRAIYCESVTPMIYDANALLGVVTSRWKYIHTRRPELYDLVADPGEAENLAHRLPDQVRTMRDHLEDVFAVEPRDGADTAVAPDARTVQRLEALGYAGGGGGESFSLDPDPTRGDAKEMIALHVTKRRISALAAKGHDAEVEKICRALVSEQPEFFDGHQHLARIAVGRGDLAGAVPHLERALAVKGDHVDSLNNLGNALLSLRRFDDAEVHLGRALEINSDFVAARYNLALLRQAQGRTEDAVRHLEYAVTIKADHAESHLRLGQLLANAGRAGTAVNHLRAAVRANPEGIEALKSLAWILAVHPEATIRDGAEAVRHAERALALSTPADLRTLDVLAAAQAEAGRFKEAVSTAESALARQGGKTAAAAITARLALYRAGKPFRATLK